MAAEAHPPAALEAIDASRRVYEAAIRSGDTEAIVKGDLAFHRAVSQASDNRFLGKFYSLSLDYGRRMNLLHYYPALSDEDRQKSIEGHAALAAAIERGRGDEAEQVARDHVLAEVRAVQRSLEPRIGSSFSLGILREANDD